MKMLLYALNRRRTVNKAHSWLVLAILPGVIFWTCATTAADKLSPNAAGKRAQDFSDPKKTYETYLQAIKADDLKAAENCWSIAETDHAGVLDTIVGMWVTAHRLGEVARAKLGEREWHVMEEWSEMVCRPDCTSEALDRTLDRLKTAKVQITGDTATVTIKWAEDEPLEKPVFCFSGDDPAARFRKIKDRWKLDAGKELDMTQAEDLFKPGSWLAAFHEQRRAQEKIISELEQGKLRSGEEAIAAFEDLLSGDATPQAHRKLGPKLHQAGVASSTLLESGGMALSMNHPPVLAVSDSGTVYVFWPARGQVKPVLSAELPTIPSRFAFGDYDRPDFSAVPGVNVCRRGAWSKPGVLIEGIKDCDPCFAWCAGEQLNLLMVDNVKGHTHHFALDARNNKWERVAELPYELTHYDSFRQVGETVHIGFAESVGRQMGEGTLPKGPDERFEYPEHTYATYLMFDGKRWSKPVRIEASDNRSRNVSRVRLAVDNHGTAHLAWWGGGHGYAVVRDGKATCEPLDLSGPTIERDEFDLGLDPHGRVIIAYKALLPEKHADARKVHIQRRQNGKWIGPEKIGGEGEDLSGMIRIVWGSRQTMVTWVNREEYTELSGVLVKGFRRFSLDDGKSWSASKWIARYPTLRGNGVPLTAQDLGICIDKQGGVHICEETRCYSLIASLGQTDKATAVDVK
jgi:hypothetical protein